MMNNLFSMFDTSTNSLIDMNWLSSILNLMFLPIYFWMFNSKINYLHKYIMNIMLIEFNTIFMNKFNKINSIFLTSLFLMIFLNNFLGLMPYIFTSSSHLIFSMSISFPLWFGMIMLMIMKNLNFMFSHFIPPNTPYILMPFMVMIETTSNMIRPSTLSIRLTANMIAGHLLITLLSQNSINSNLMIIIIIILTQMILLSLEFSVSIIQSYVFSILSSLYLKETN